MVCHLGTSPEKERESIGYSTHPRLGRKRTRGHTMERASLESCLFLEVEGKKTMRVDNGGVLEFG